MRELLPRLGAEFTVDLWGRRRVKYFICCRYLLRRQFTWWIWNHLQFVCIKHEPNRTLNFIGDDQTAPYTVALRKIESKYADAELTLKFQNHSPSFEHLNKVSSFSASESEEKSPDTTLILTKVSRVRCCLRFFLILLDYFSPYSAETRIRFFEKRLYLKYCDG